MSNGGFEFAFGVAAASDRDEIADAYRQAFGFDATRSHIYIEQVGEANFRTLRVGSELAATMAVIKTGHWLGGRPISAINIAHVAINPAWRGAGVAGRFLELVCAETDAAVATLFASTRPVYRKAGFALAGLEMVYEAETSELPRVKETSFSRVSSDDVRHTILPLYRKFCETDAGLLDRSAAHWASLLAGDVSIYASRSPDAPGYIILDTANPECLVIRDWAAVNGLAARHILSFLGTFASVYPLIRWHGSPQDSLIFALPDKGWRMVHQEEWLARVLDPAKALAQRGYASDIELVFELRSFDATERLGLRVRDGRGEVIEPHDGVPTIKLAKSDFGTLLSGHRSASFLARAGVLSADATAIRSCEAAFAGPAPWVGEHF